MRTRGELEQHERQVLAPYAVASVDSRGRRFPEPEPPYRTAFQRDRERVLHTTAFRRLQGKTQVFIVTEGDYYRTRITHTLEVAQIGRTVARALGANEDLVEGICLAHDLGHPPFGHAGERTLNELMASRGGFNHNAQSFRIITELERRYPDFPGLNLTYEFREGILKHQADQTPAHAGPEYEPELRGTVEAQIAAIVDELAYNAHDLDDGLRSGLLDDGEARTLGWWQRACGDAGVDPLLRLDEIARHRVIRRLIGLMVTELLRESAARIAQLTAAAGRSLTVDDVRHHDDVLIAFPEETDGLNRELKAFLYERLYYHPRVIRMTRKAVRVLTDLFGAYLAEPRMIGDAARAKSHDAPLERAVCDYVAGMTDRFALDEHARLFDPRERV